jgi:hypothetical protein
MSNGQVKREIAELSKQTSPSGGIEPRYDKNMSGVMAFLDCFESLLQCGVSHNRGRAP